MKEEKNEQEVKVLECDVLSTQVEVTEEKQKIFVVQVVMPIMPKEKVKIVQE